MYYRFLALMIFPVDAYAYIDPGSGILLWQGLLAFIGGLLLFVRNPSEALRKIVRKWRNRKDIR